MVWSGCALGQSGGLCENGSATGLSIEALNDPESGCQGLNYAGHDDWVAPSLAQLMSLVTRRDNMGANAERFGLPIDLFGPAVRGVEPILWTNTHVARAGYAEIYAVYPSRFGITSNDSMTNYAGLCVRAGGQWEEPFEYPTDHCRDAVEYRLQSRWNEDTARFTRPDPTVVSEPIVSDALYGIDWTGCLSGATGVNCSNGMVITHGGEGPAETCDRLRWDSSSNWRLPTGRELTSLHDYTSSNRFTATVTAEFPGLSNMENLG